MNFKKEKYKSGEKALTKTEYEKLIKAIGNLEHELLIRLAVATGIRREDIVNIRIKDIDLKNCSLSFYERKKKKIHTVFFSEEIEKLIEKHLNTIKKREKLFDFSGRTAWNILNHYCEIAGIEKRPFHALRATCVKFAQDAGWTAQQTAAHIDDTIETVQEHYSIPSKGEMADLAKKKAIEKIKEVI